MKTPILSAVFFCIFLIACSNEPKVGEWYEDIATGKTYRIENVDTAKNIWRLYGLDKPPFSNEYYAELNNRLDRLYGMDSSKKILEKLTDEQTDKYLHQLEFRKALGYEFFLWDSLRPCVYLSNPTRRDGRIIQITELRKNYKKVSE